MRKVTYEWVVESGPGEFLANLSGSDEQAPRWLPTRDLTEASRFAGRAEALDRTRGWGPSRAARPVTVTLDVSPGTRVGP